MTAGEMIATLLNFDAKYKVVVEVDGVFLDIEEISWKSLDSVTEKILPLQAVIQLKEREKE